MERREIKFSRKFIEYFWLCEKIVFGEKLFWVSKIVLFNDCLYSRGLEVRDTRRYAYACTGKYYNLLIFPLLQVVNQSTII